MSEEPTITDAQRAEWAELMEDYRKWARGNPWDFPSRELHLAIDSHLTFLEADHARLAEENLRLAAELEKYRSFERTRRMIEGFRQ